MIKGIFFDAADVFYERRESTASFAQELLKQRGYRVDVSAQDLVRQKDLHMQATEGRIGHEEFWSEFLQMRGVVDAAQRKILVQQIIEQAHDVVTIPGGRTAMAALKQRGFVLGIVTDTMYPVEWKMAWLKKVGIAEFIDIIACSTVLGAHKPNPEIYVNAMQQAKLAPNESAFVGHDAHELAGARRAGMTTVAVNFDPDAKADFYCTSLLDLLNVPIFQVVAA
jgi:HAD superfamily hydrolase (TIGR01509 family)